ncbi:hypothetical protein A3E46_02335 [Candidatus Woesebacteria bacterium RIFCSPHIGHO2_12_FULL_46_16]|uniref:SurA N-terminal domain-containing protein n=1 Tax=Candidatus Woesebacteria bacterium RIFCSPHIGHO2_12_FULL_46_16 TaxID=1802513 RepID=A0A1F8AZ59_9BACT|nr:MAG: hypothetical protein A3E46_02335 [Candidatus Woesebacteria bacterium RIFCSPHIGHO2_12_FULL_46_16]
MKKFLARLRLLISFKNKRFRVALAILAVAAVLALGKSFLFAAFVNGTPISRIKVLKELEKQGGSQILDTLIQRSLIFQEAKRQGVKIDEDAVSKQLTQIEDTLKGQNLTLDDALSARGQTRADLTDQIKIQLMVEAILGNKITITDEEISAYFNENKDLYEKGKTLEEVKDDIKAQLFQERLNSEYSKWIQELKTKAKIFLLVNYN